MPLFSPTSRLLSGTTESRSTVSRLKLQKGI